MASATSGGAWLKGRVKGVQSGDSLIITALIRSAGPPPEKTVTLSSIMAPRLARRGTIDEPFAWDSREYLRKLCIGKEVTFRVEYTLPGVPREFGSVFLGDKNLAYLVVAEGWAKVKAPSGPAKESPSPYVQELQKLEEQAESQGLGLWSKVPGAAQASIRDLPPSAVGDTSNVNVESLVVANKGRALECFVEQVRDGSSLRVYLLPEFQFVQVLLAGAQAQQVGRRVAPEMTTETEVAVAPSASNGADSNEARGPLTSAQRLHNSAPATPLETPAEPFALEAKYFTEMRTLHRDVRLVIEGVDRNKTSLIGSVYYPDGESAKDLSLELVKHGLARYVDWSGKEMEEEPRKKLREAELEAKKNKLKIWTNYVPPVSNSKAIHDQNFTGKVVEVVSGDCVVVADDSIPYGSPMAERRVNLSSIRCPKMGNPRRDEKPAPWAREAKELLRTRLISRQVTVEMEYSRKVSMADGTPATAASTDTRVMDFGSVFLVSSPTKSDGDNAAGAGAPAGINVSELVLGRGFGTVISHRDFEERSKYYDALVAAENRAKAAKKGIHSSKAPPVAHITDLVTASSKKARDFLPFLQRSRRIPAVVEYVFSGHRFKLQIPKETCSFAFSFSGVRCPGRGEPYSDEAIALMRRKILQRDVEIEVETVDRTGTFLGSMWDSKQNAAIPLLEAGLAKLQTSFGSDRISEVHLLERAEETAKKQKLKVWENYVEGQEVPNGSAATESKKKEVLKVVVTEIIGGGKFYVQTVGDQQVASIQNKLASLNLHETPLIGAFNPKKGEIVLAQFSADNSWNRAMIVNTPRGPVSSPHDKFEVFYIDYGNQEIVTFSQLRPIDPSVSAATGLAQLCSLAFIKVPTLEEDFGQEAAEYLSENTLNSGKELIATVEERDTSGGKLKGQGTGTVLLVTLRATDSEESINAAMLQEGLARLEKRKRWDTKDRVAIFDNLETYQEKARSGRSGIWEYGDIQSDDEDMGPPARKPASGGRR